MRIVDWVVFIGTRGDFAKRAWIKQFPAAKCGLEKVAVSLASVQTSAANTGLWSHIAGSVFCPESLIGIWLM
jgi:hypothetical protein